MTLVAAALNLSSQNIKCAATMNLWALPTHGVTTDWVSKAHVRRNHAIIRRYSVSSMSVR